MTFPNHHINELLFIIILDSKGQLRSKVSDCDKRWMRKNSCGTQRGPSLTLRQYCLVIHDHSWQKRPLPDKGAHFFQQMFTVQIGGASCLVISILAWELVSESIRNITRKEHFWEATWKSFLLLQLWGYIMPQWDSLLVHEYRPVWSYRKPLNRRTPMFYSQFEVSSVRWKMHSVEE